MTAQKQLRDWLAREGRKQSWVAAHLGVHKNAVTSWVKGYNVPLMEHRLALAAMTGLDIAGPDAWKDKA